MDLPEAGDCVAGLRGLHGHQGRPIHHRHDAAERADTHQPVRLPDAAGDRFLQLHADRFVLSTCFIVILEGFVLLGSHLQTSIVLRSAILESDCSFLTACARGQCLFHCQTN